MGIGLQLYTLRDESERDFVGTLRKVAEAGYEGVEFAGYGNLSAEELKTILEDLNLQAVGCHVGLERISDHLTEELAFHQTLGTQHVVVPWLDESLRTQHGLVYTAKVLNDAGQAFASVGIRFGYHNHDFEFKHIVGGEFFLDALLGQTSSEFVFAELDTAWIHHAGQDAAGYVRRYANRSPLIHLKDLRVENQEVLTVPLGEGDVPLTSIVRAAESSGVQWLIVEQDNLQRDPWDSIRTSRTWLDHAFQVK